MGFIHDTSDPRFGGLHLETRRESFKVYGPFFVYPDPDSACVEIEYAQLPGLHSVLELVDVHQGVTPATAELPVMRDLVNAIRAAHDLAPVSDPMTCGEYDETLEAVRGPTAPMLAQVIRQAMHEHGPDCAQIAESLVQLFGGRRGEVQHAPIPPAPACDCDLRDRRWNPNTGRCEGCGRSYKRG